MKRSKLTKRIIQWKGRRIRTPPSLGFWPKSGSATDVPRSLLLRVDTVGMTMGRMRLRVRTPKSWDPPSKKKVPRPKQRKTLTPWGDSLLLEGWIHQELLLVGHNPLRGVMKLVLAHELIELGIIKAVSILARKIKQKWCRYTDLTSSDFSELHHINKVTKLKSPSKKFMHLHSIKIKV